VTKHKSPHTQTEQNVVPEQADFETPQGDFESEAGENTYDQMQGAKTGMDRSPRLSRKP
jgi:hypothetical protein